MEVTEVLRLYNLSLQGATSLSD